MAEPLDSLDTRGLVDELCAGAKDSSSILLQASDAQVDGTLQSLAAALRDNHDLILEANEKDVEAARARDLAEALIDRLSLDADRIEGIASGVETVQSFPCPVGKVLWQTERPNGLDIQRVAVPIGVLGMIYESRPNVTVDAAALCLKSRNAVVLRGGSESLHSSIALHGLIQAALIENDLPPECVSMIPISDRAAVGHMLAANNYIDVMIPRGGRGLIERVMNEARMPVFGHLDGLCHIYIHPSAQADIAREVTLNAKMRRTGVCGAVETLLLDSALDQTIAKDVVSTLLDNGCEVVGDKLARALDSRIGEAAAADWTTEYLAPKISVAVVSGAKEAVKHINSYGSHHTDSILCEDADAAQYFLNNVDSGIVLHNASTQFADGGEFGMGAEIGIATGKMHARGPVGLEQLCTYKYIVRGTGQTRP